MVGAWLLPLVNYRGSVSRFGGLRASPEQLCAPQPLCTHNMGQPGQFWGPHPPSPPQGAAFGQLPARLHHARGPAASRCHTAPPGMLSTRCPVPVPAPRACAVAFLANPLASRRPFWKPPPPIVPAATSQGDAMLLSLSTLSAHHHFLWPLSAKTPPWQGLVPSPVVLPLLPTPCGAGQRDGSKTLVDSHSPSSALTLVPALQSAPADFPVLQTLPPISCWIPVSLPSPASAKQSVKIEAGLHPNTIVNCSPERSLGRLRIAPGAGENECVQGGMNLKVMAGPPM